MDVQPCLSCLCCGHPLLRHIRRQGVYWFCMVCHQEMVPLTPGESPIPIDILSATPNSPILRSRSLDTVHS